MLVCEGCLGGYHLWCVTPTAGEHGQGTRLMSALHAQEGHSQEGQPLQAQQEPACPELPTLTDCLRHATNSSKTAARASRGISLPAACPLPAHTNLGRQRQRRTVCRTVQVQSLSADPQSQHQPCLRTEPCLLHQLQNRLQAMQVQDQEAQQQGQLERACTNT